MSSEDMNEYKQFNTVVLYGCIYRHFDQTGVYWCLANFDEVTIKQQETT